MQNMQLKLLEGLFLSGCVLLISVYIGGWVIIPSIVNSQIESEFVLANGTRLWEEWLKEKQVDFRIYIFNVSNPAEIEAGGEPVIHELGPYVYNKIMTRVLTEELTGNDTVVYEDIYTYHFNEELSNGSQDDEIMVLNIPFLAVTDQLSTYPFYIRYLVSSYLMKFKSQVFVQRKVREYLFEGTFEPMISEIQKITGQNQLPNSTFGVFYGKNGTKYGRMEVYSGAKDPSRVGGIFSWKGNSKLDFWDGPFCNMMNGTDATVFASSVAKGKYVDVFDYDICRSLRLAYSSEVSQSGILGYRFEIGKYVLDRNNPDNRCFCLDKDFDKCLPSGVYSIKSCQNGAPLAISTPHFYNGDPVYAKKFGLSPQARLHDSEAILEPNTGAPLYILKRIQINAEVKKLSTMQKFKDIQNMMFPLIWIQEEYTMKQELIAELQTMLLTPLHVVHIMTLLLLSCGCVLILTALLIFTARARRKSVFV